MPQLISEDIELIEADLSILESMSHAFEAYLHYDGPFYPLEIAIYTRLSLGGLLLRRNRLAGNFRNRYQLNYERVLGK